jgi:hypothetical protein
MKVITETRRFIKKKQNKKTTKRQHNITQVNDKINMDSAITGSINAHS